MNVEQFLLEDIQILIIDVKTHLERTRRHPSLPFQERDNLFEDVVECHVRLTTETRSMFMNFLYQSRLQEGRAQLPALDSRCHLLDNGFGFTI